MSMSIKARLCLAVDIVGRREHRLEGAIRIVSAGGIEAMPFANNGALFGAIISAYLKTPGELVMESLLTDLTVSMSDFKKNPAKVLREAKAQPVAVLSHNKAAFYMVDPMLFEALIDEVEDAQLLPMLKARIASAARGNYTKIDIDSV